MQSSIEYWVDFRPLRCSAVPILNDMSAWSIQSSIGYWVNLRPLLWSRCSNIEWHVSLTHAVKHWILGRSLATPMFPIYQYWMTCQPDLCNHALNIRSIFGHSDVSAVPILNNIFVSPHPYSQVSIEYWVDLRPLRCFQCPNIGWHGQPNPYSQALNIELMFGHSDVSYIPILNDMSAWPMQSGMEY